ncbi:MAG: hypothetical protein HY996_01670, partial [Micrococcales bacterium]|nr:hypothetical protein [Micrococcales bacterium]
MPAADSIDHRLAALLEILDARGVGLPPAADRGALDFRRVRVGGQSQGGGHAGFIAREQVVERSCFLGSIVDAVIEPDG